MARTTLLQRTSLHTSRIHQADKHDRLQPASPARGVVAIFVLAWALLYCDRPIILAQGPTSIAPTAGTGDLGTTVTRNGHTVQITGGTRPDNGVNLFHSFDQFNVGRSDTAQFLNTTPALQTSNILGRVTGGTPSNIFGTIDTTSYPAANLFLMNPAGMVFGPHATLNVAGSVTFTTASYLRLADNGQFRAVPNVTADSLLSTAPVVAYGFLGTTPEAIAVQGSHFTAPKGNGISLVGGSITVQSGTLNHGSVQPSQLTAPSGRIALASVTSPGEIATETLDTARLAIGQSSDALGTIQISHKSVIDTSGAGGGTVLIRSGRLLINDSTVSANTVATSAGAFTGPFGNGIDIHVAHEATLENKAVLESNASGPVASSHGSGGVRISAHDITIAGGPGVLEMAQKSPDGSFPFSGIRSNIGPTSTAGRSGDITLEAHSIHIQDLGQIQTQTVGRGNAGHISLKTVGTIDLNSAIVSSESNTSSGHAGNLRFSSGQGDVHVSSSFITSQTIESSGNAGAITFTAPLGDIVLTDMSQVLNATRGTGALRGIQIDANNLQLQGESRIDGDNFSTRVAENISLMLKSRLSLTEHSAIETATSGSTNAANLVIKASDVLIAQGSRLFTGTTGSGAGGAIDLSARTLTIQDSGKISAETSGTASSATGGSITVNATDQVMLTNGASVTSSSIVTPQIPHSGIADAGHISINAGQQLDVMNGSSITTTTQTPQANGGDIAIRAIDRIRLVESTISTSVLGAEGNGGNIFIDPQVVVLQGSTVAAKAVGGAGGNITFVTPLFLADSSSTVSASSERGPSGTVTVQSPTSNLSETVGQLVSKISPPQVLLQNRCVAQPGGEHSTLIVTGRDALPAEPGGWLNTPVVMDHWMREEMEHASSLMVQKKGPHKLPTVVAQKNEGTIVSLRRLTPPGFLVRTFATSSTGCPS